MNNKLWLSLPILIASPCFAAGFRLPEAAVEGVALSNALVANPELAGAFPYNYAVMSFHEGTTFAIDTISILGNMSVEPMAPNQAGDKIDSDFDNTTVPSVYWMQTINANWSWGIHAGIPFSLSNEWPASTFTQFAQIDAATGAGGALAGLHPTSSRLDLYAISPSVSYQFSEQFSAAVGLDYYRVHKVELNTVGTNTRGSGDEMGWNAAVMYHAAPWTLGASFHSAATVDIDGVTDIIGLGRSTGSTSFTLPSRLQVGMNYRFNERLSAELDIEHIAWRRFDNIRLISTGGAVPAGITLSENQYNWDDSYNVRLGFVWRQNDNTDWLLGLGYEQSPQSNQYFDPALSEADRYMVSIGLNQRLGDGWLIKLGYQYGWQKSRTITGHNYGQQLLNSGGSHTDPNGSDAYNGRYQGDMHLLGIGMTKQF